MINLKMKRKMLENLHLYQAGLPKEKPNRNWLTLSNPNQKSLRQVQHVSNHNCHS